MRETMEKESNWKKRNGVGVKMKTNKAIESEGSYYVLEERMHMKREGEKKFF